MGWIKKFSKSEASGGVLLFLGAALAIILANTPLRTLYFDVLNTPIVLSFGALHFDESLQEWINDGLMTLFFLMVGLEVKRELFRGNVHSLDHMRLPILGAVGGMLVPALFYTALNYDNAFNMQGWAIPTATDIAFSLAILSLLGSRVPLSLKIFLTTLAIVDDILAILLIAFFYTDSLSILALLGVCVCTIVLITFNRIGIKSLLAYGAVGIVLWWFMLHSGVHATLSGIILAFAIPTADIHTEEKDSPLSILEHLLAPWVKYLILPIFALANSGLTFDYLSFRDLLHPIPLGICLGLFVGKQLGISLFCWCAVKSGFAHLPDKMTWLELYGIAILCGVGFTLSLLIGHLAFIDESYSHLQHIKFGIIVGSLLSGLCGYCVLYIAQKCKMR